VRLSRFVLAIRDAAPGEHVLYDVVGDRYVGVDGPTLAAIERWSDGPPAPGAEVEAAAALAELGLVVRDRAEDDARLARHRAATAEGIPGTAYVTLMPTLACNLACSYCFQKDHPAVGRMSEDTEAAAVDWIARQAVASGAQRLLVQYLGGEPLLRKDFIRRTARELALRMRAAGLGFSWGITTNGLALEPGLVAELCALGPGSIIVTLDGDRAEHDAARVHRDGRGSFDAILAALVAVATACPDVVLKIAGNLRPGGGASVPALLDRLAALGLGGRIEAVHFKPVIDAGGGCNAACGSAVEGDRLARLAFERGIARRPPPGIDAVACELHWKRGWVVDPAGRIYRCLVVAGRPELALGHVRGGELAHDPLVAGRPWERCGDCPFVPVCLGGCLGGRYLQLGRPGETLCDRAGLEARYRAEITRRYLEEFHPDARAPASDVLAAPAASPAA
jgi:uncharacterized protein